MSEFETAALLHMERLVFLGQVVAVAAGFIAGAFTWRLIVLAKNQSWFW